MPSPIKVLFVCGRNNRRSPTAETIFKTDRRVLVRSAGLSDTSKRKITESDLAWADLVLVMERKHASRIKCAFNHLDSLPPMESLNIKDEYIFMQPELIEVLRTSLDTAIEKYNSE